jgi:hypothetical protein
MPVPVAAEKRERLCKAVVVVCALVQRWKETVDKDGDLKSNNAVSSTVVKFLKYSQA